MRGALPVFWEPDELMKSVLSGDRRIKNWIQLHVRYLSCTAESSKQGKTKWQSQRSWSARRKRSPSIRQCVTFIRCMLWQHQASVCLRLKMSVWQNGLEVMLKCACRRIHGVIHHNYKNGRKEKSLSGRNFLTVQFGPTVVCYRK